MGKRVLGETTIVLGMIVAFFLLIPPVFKVLCAVLGAYDRYFRWWGF